MHLFADDTNHFIRSKVCNSLQAEAETELANIVRWLSANQLTPNYSKTNFTIFTPKSKSAGQYYFNCINVGKFKINKTEKIKFLGIIIDEHLMWKDHIDYVLQRVKRLSSIFFKVRYKIPAPCLKQIYFSMVHSILQYGVEIYANCIRSHLNELIILNNRILRTLQFGNIRTKLKVLYNSYRTYPVNVLT